MPLDPTVHTQSGFTFNDCATFIIDANTKSCSKPKGNVLLISGFSFWVWDLGSHVLGLGFGISFDLRNPT